MMMTIMVTLILNDAQGQGLRWCTCEKHGLVECNSNDECQSNTQCSTKMVSHIGDEQHMRDQLLTCCFEQNNDNEQSIYYYVSHDFNYEMERNENRSNVTYITCTSVQHSRYIVTHQKHCNLIITQ